MYVARVLGPADSGKTTVVERLTSVLAESGRVATVSHHGPDLDPGTDTSRHREAGAATAVGIGDGWVATGEDRDLRETLDSLATDHDYALLSGFREARVPTVVLGGEDADTASGIDDAAEVLARGETAGDVDVDAVVDRLHETDPHESLASLVAQVKRSPDADRAGAIATFTGRVRERDDPEDAPTEHLHFEKYDGVADERLAALREDLVAREGVFDVRLHHRTGLVPAGEDIVFVVILAGHRREAFDAVEDGIDRLKAEVPLFKREVTVDGEFWAHEGP